ncbi:CHAD domain-containing protein [Thalassobacillus sp. CUG 92003]|uniref:CHAD domain-containing protein n=1 Tax=Thalassobacillus sp. CUG 92003 TaxID=2736641 RepID=UPI0015E6F861|nr:CHAD domain-containing protein [Thalassobacillus sp. CUG 92003]
MSETYVRQLDKIGRVVIPKEIRDELELSNQPLDVQMTGDGLKLSKTESGEEPKTLDQYGRLVIPIELRQELDWEQGKHIEMRTEKDEVQLNGQFEVCEICENNQSLIKVKTKFVCRDCLSEGNQNIVHRWGDLLDGLMSEYLHYCKQALRFEDEEDTHQARVKDRRLKALLQFIGVSEKHDIIKSLEEAHKRLGAVRERDVLIAGFKAFEEYVDEERMAEVYREVYQRVEQKRKKHQEKLEEKLPAIIDQNFQERWRYFIDEELHAYILSLSVASRLDEYEQDIANRMEDYKAVVAEHGPASQEALESMHALRIASKHIRYIYKYLDTMYEQDYQTSAKYYEQLQDQFGPVNDVKDWLKAFDKQRDKLDIKKKHAKEVKAQLEDELESRVNEVKVD